jgi:hypothetical protein
MCQFISLIFANIVTAKLIPLRKILVGVAKIKEQ